LNFLLLDRFSEENFLLYRLECEMLLWEWAESMQLMVDWVDSVDWLHNTHILMHGMYSAKLHRLHLMELLVDRLKSTEFYWLDLMNLLVHGMKATEFHWLDLMKFLMNGLQLRMGDTQHIVVDRDNVVDSLEGTVSGVHHLRIELMEDCGCVHTVYR